MPVPDFQKVLLPLLTIANDKKEHSVSEASEKLANDIFHLSADERKETLPSGTQSKFDNRVGWAKTYLVKAGLLTVPKRGIFCITERGASVLAANPGELSTNYLMKFPEFQEFQHRTRDEQITTTDVSTTAQTPDEIIDSNYVSLRSQLASELIERVKKCSPKFFEELVVDLIVTMGYGGSIQDAGKAVGQSGDGGIDGIIKEDKLGLDAVYIQAKRWEGSVGRPVIQSFSGSLDGHKAKKGIVITTSQFTQDARDYVTKIDKKIVLIDGEYLAQLMIDNNIAVTTEKTYEIKKIDFDYFEEN